MSGIKCGCDLRTRLVGDGCHICNPALALEYLRGTVEDQSDRIEELEAALAEAQAEQDAHIYRLREQISRDTDTIYTLRGLLTLARDALADCLDDAPTADQLSVSGGVYEGVAAKSAIRAIDEALERTT